VRIEWLAAAEGDPVRRGELSFDDPVLAGWRWPLAEIRGDRPGPRFCVIAGMHVNEVSSIEAAMRLSRSFAPATLRGSVSIIPVLNLPALYEHTEYACPLDGRNINFTFPGRPGGSFSEALCHSLLQDWAAGADLFIDMHGGDLRENVAKFIMYQRTGEAARDAARRDLARSFDADLVVGLEPELMDKPGRSCTALAALGRAGLLSEGGANGIVDEASVQFHLSGALNAARLLGMIDGPVVPAARRRLDCERYLWIPTPADGFLKLAVEAAQPVAEGQLLGEVHDLFGRPQAELRAPVDGVVLWRMTHPVLRQGEFALGLAVPKA
jgi:predicted deacylase